jgi:hypothetical protein
MASKVWTGGGTISDPKTGAWGTKNNNAHTTAFTIEG